MLNVRERWIFKEVVDEVWVGEEESGRV